MRILEVERQDPHLAGVRGLGTSVLTMHNLHKGIPEFECQAAYTDGDTKNVCLSIAQCQIKL